MTKPERLSLTEHLGVVPDPRMARTQRHKLLEQSDLPVRLPGSDQLQRALLMAVGFEV